MPNTEVGAAPAPNAPPAQAPPTMRPPYPWGCMTEEALTAEEAQAPPCGDVVDKRRKASYCVLRLLGPVAQAAQPGTTLWDT